MGAKALLQRLRRALRRKTRSTRGEDDGPDRNSGDPGISSPTKTPIIIHQGLESAQDASIRTITRAEMQQSASNQDDSIFFSRLPLELRRQIYREVWRGYLKSRRVSPSSPGSDLRLHIYTDGSGRGTLRHTQCKIHPGSPGQDDAQVIEPWPPFDRSNTHMPPMWFWFAWVMRLHWDKHWKCQHAIMKRWDPLTGNAKDAEPSPFLPLFLTCKKMYWEAIASLFENVTPIFTTSEDAHRFFIQKPHPFLGHIRSLEFSFTNSNDHLFLAQVRREPGSGKAAPASVAGGPSTGGHPCMTMPCRLEIFGQQLWSELVQGVQNRVPDLRDFDITIGGRMAHNAAMARFGSHEEEIAAEGDTDTDVGVWQERDAPETWALPGKLAVFFKTDERRYVQEGSKMVRKE
ncbi:hypothetical protein B0T25DRAFT_456652 [Lasiosphaeria hispida]|uniref:Uncharacterized protein n=1 Tax=Lasiosphaeria hispida TaxID=260671 RepID=A0AAJ0HJ92_9PEZI|nr:hypothetical protein B0T25DRAFT_456652 [Lasiosphaeria hispida]